MTRTNDRTELLAGALVIDGAIRTTASLGTLEHVNPATGRHQASFPCGGAEEIDEAVRAARRALEEWRSWPGRRRGATLRRLAEVVREHAEELATVNALETGSPYHGFVERLRAGLPAWLEYYAGWADKVTGETVQLDPGVGADFTVVEPVGVVGKILTWNTPLVNIQMSIPAALAAGCTVVLKPAELAPFACIRFGELCLQAGLPPGVVNVVPGGAEAGAALAGHPGVDKLSFTGGFATAGRVLQGAAGSLRPTVMELGGKSPNLVFADADLDRAIGHASGVVRLAGQACTLPTRLLVERSVFDQVVAGVAERFRAVQVGDPFDPGTQMGPVISEAACERILAMVDRARRGGAIVHTGGERLGGPLASGFFVAPTLVTGLAHTDELAQDEVFGPVLVAVAFEDEDEAIELANQTRYGLAAYVHTRDIGRALRASARLEAGNVGINGGGAPAGPAAPFGGFRDSGFGKEGGREGLWEFLRVKNVNIALS
jgi:aldehyde dehydrogenase (NAD+)